MKNATQSSDAANVQTGLSYADVVRKARHGHRDWLVWHGRDGSLRAAVKTAATIKAMLLEVGTRGKWYLVGANDGVSMIGSFRMGQIMLNNCKYGY
jgi:hypothetical protein